MKMTTIVMLPGIGGSNADHWQTLWEGSHSSMRRFNPPDWDKPELFAWCSALQDAVDAAESPVVLVAHSLSCLLIAHWAAQARSVVAGAFLVAVPDPQEPAFPSVANSFRNVPKLPLPFRSIIVASTDDPYGGIEYMERCAREWGSELVNVGTHGHINASSNLGEWREGKCLLRDFVSDLGLEGF
jgi:predicted alpha/beta hydrolase family esterase